MSFADDVIERMNEVLGTSPEQSNIDELVRRFFLEDVIGKETLRKIIRDGYEPSPVVKQRLAQRLGLSLADDKENLTLAADGWKTREFVQSFLQGVPFVQDVQAPDKSPDLKFHIALGAQTHLIRCLDDVACMAGPVTEGYFVRHIVDTEAYILNDLCDSVTLLTHNVIPEGPLFKERKTRSVRLISLAEFLGTYFSLDPRIRDLREILISTGIATSEQICRIPATFKQSDTSDRIPDAITALSDLLSSDDPFVCAILGSFGTGKTSLCHRLCHDLLRRSRDQQQLFPLPVFIEAKDLVSVSGLEGAIADTVLYQYGLRMSGSFISSLVEQQHLVIFIDALDESSIFANPGNIYQLIERLPGNGRGKYILTSRTELFESTEDEEFALPLDSVYRLILHPITEQEAIEAFESRIGHSLITEVRQHPYFFAALASIIQTPLFLSYSRYLNPTMIDRLEDGSITIANVATQIIDSYVQRWAQREKERTLAQRLEVSERNRRHLCRRIALLTTDTSIDEGQIQLDTLRQAVTHWDIPDTTVNRLLTCAQLSMLLIRDYRDGKGEVWRFSHAVLAEYFLAEEIIAEAELIIAGKPPLDDYDKISTPALALHDLASVRHSLIPLFLAGRMNPPNGVERLCEVLDTARRSAITRCLCDKTSTILPNVARLACSGSAYLPEPIDISLDGLSLSFIDLRQANVAESSDYAAAPSVHISLKCTVIEFAKSDGSFAFEGEKDALGPFGITEKASLDLDPLARLPRVRQFCLENGVVLEDPDAPAGLVDPLDNSFRWIVVPGGAWKVRRVRGKDDDSLVTIYLPTFLIQQHPVTNGQFLRFIQENQEWSPLYQRKPAGGDRGNVYYLRQWNPIERDPNFGPDPYYWNTERLIEIYPGWHNIPVVFVSFLAATSFADYYGLLLPSEAQYEIAGRLRQESPSPYPWGGAEVDLDGYAIYASGDESLRAVPDWDCTVANPRYPSEGDQRPELDLERFVEWAVGHNHEVPYHIVGGVAEWTRDFWSDHWPPQRAGEIVPIDPCNDGLRVDDDLRVHRDAAARKFRAVRGGGLHSPASDCYIGRRLQMIPWNVNQDVGYRCTKRVWGDVAARQGESNDR